jgi:hypothetical protein
MASDLNVPIAIGARDASRNAHAAQLRQEGRGDLANLRARIDRRAFLTDEHNFSAHDFGIELYDALFAGDVGRAYQRLIGQVGSEAAIRVQLVIRSDPRELHALPWRQIFHV